MIVPIFQHCSYSFTGADKAKHSLHVRVTSSLDLEWVLYINDSQVGRFLDTKVNILINSQLYAALDYRNIINMYNDLLPKQP